MNEEYRAEIFQLVRQILIESKPANIDRINELFSIVGAANKERKRSPSPTIGKLLEWANYFAAQSPGDFQEFKEVVTEALNQQFAPIAEKYNPLAFDLPLPPSLSAQANEPIVYFSKQTFLKPVRALPIQLTVANNHLPGLERLLAVGADLWQDYPEFEETSLFNMLSINSKRGELFSYLLKRGCFAGDESSKLKQIFSRISVEVFKGLLHWVKNSPESLEAFNPAVFILLESGRFDLCRELYLQDFPLETKVSESFQIQLFKMALKDDDLELLKKQLTSSLSKANESIATELLFEVADKVNSRATADYEKLLLMMLPLPGCMLFATKNGLSLHQRLERCPLNKDTRALLFKIGVQQLTRRIIVSLQNNSMHNQFITFKNDAVVLGLLSEAAMEQIEYRDFFLLLLETLQKYQLDSRYYRAQICGNQYYGLIAEPEGLNNSIYNFSFTVTPDYLGQLADAFLNWVAITPNQLFSHYPNCGNFLQFVSYRFLELTEAQRIGFCYQGLRAYYQTGNKAQQKQVIDLIACYVPSFPRLPENSVYDTWTHAAVQFFKQQSYNTAEFERGVVTTPTVGGRVTVENCFQQLFNSITQQEEVGNFLMLMKAAREVIENGTGRLEDVIRANFPAVAEKPYGEQYRDMLKKIPTIDPEMQYATFWREHYTTMSKNNSLQQQAWNNLQQPARNSAVMRLAR